MNLYEYYAISLLKINIQYIVTGNNAQRFSQLFKDIKFIKIPKVYWDATRERVLTMEYTPGVKINNKKALDEMGVDRKYLAKIAVESYLLQLLRFGFFHADPHPGNISVGSDNGGCLIYYDFGMMGEIPPDIRDGLRGLFYGVYKKDPESCLIAL